jgi:hypothetical protein
MLTSRFQLTLILQRVMTELLEKCFECTNTSKEIWIDFPSAAGGQLLFLQRNGRLDAAIDQRKWFLLLEKELLCGTSPQLGRWNLPEMRFADR